MCGRWWIVKFVVQCGAERSSVILSIINPQILVSAKVDFEVQTQGLIRQNLKKQSKAKQSKQASKKKDNRTPLVSWWCFNDNTLWITFAFLSFFGASFWLKGKCASFPYISKELGSINQISTADLSKTKKQKKKERATHWLTQDVESDQELHRKTCESIHFRYNFVVINPPATKTARDPFPPQCPPTPSAPPAPLRADHQHKAPLRSPTVMPICFLARQVPFFFLVLGAYYNA